MAQVTVLDHPLLRHKLTLLRDRTTPTAQFRQVAREISLLMAYEVTRDLPLEPIDIETPLEPMRAEHWPARNCASSRFCAPATASWRGCWIWSPPPGSVISGYIATPATLQPVEYYLKLPSDIAERLVILVDPMLATGHSAVAAASRLKQAGVGGMKFVCLMAAPEGIETFTQAHPDVPVFTGAIDRELDSHGYIRPGLGDAGDRFYGTR